MDTSGTMTEPHSDPAVLVEHLHQRYRTRVAVDDVSLRVDPGEILGVLGANGAGKTTTVELIAGLRRRRAHDRGTVRVFGLDPQRDRTRLREILGVQLQTATLHGDLTVRELIDLYRTFYPNPRSREDLLDLVDLHDHQRVRFDRLSGGQQQRVSIALALTGRPRLVILDELTTGLDPRARRRMWGTIEQIRDEGCTVILVSHAMDEVERLCDRVVLLDHGRVIASGAPTALVSEAGVTDLEAAFVALTGRAIELEEESV